jgi:hypothetical protein
MLTRFFGALLFRMTNDESTRVVTKLETTSPTQPGIREVKDADFNQ